MKRVVLVLAFMAFISGLAGALPTVSLVMGTEKTVYAANEAVLLTVTLAASDDIYGVLRVEFINAEESKYYAPEVFEEVIDLKAGEGRDFSFPFSIAETTPSGKYYARARVLDNNMQLLLEDEISFDVIGTKKILEINLLVCEDPACSERPSVFVRNQEIYLDYESEAPNPAVTATLTYPDSTKQQVSLPASVKAEQSGAYLLEVSASADGYKTATGSIQFAVIEREADIPYLQEEVACGNGLCDAGETFENCPQDCPSQITPPYEILTAFGIFVVILIAVGVLYFRKKS